MVDPPMEERLAAVRGRIEAAAARAGRSPGGVRLLGASKTVPAERLARAVVLGMTDLGENRVQEAEGKIPLVLPRPRWHLIGHLQSNKARRAAALFDCVQSIDSPRIADALDRHVGELGRPALEVLVEVNVSGEAAKHGVAPGDTAMLVEYVRKACPRIVLTGLMTVGPIVDRPEDARLAYRSLALLGHDFGLKTISMGMSGDFEIAIEEGATMVRVGSALFGARG